MTTLSSDLNTWQETDFAAWTIAWQAVQSVREARATAAAHALEVRQRIAALQATRAMTLALAHNLAEKPIVPIGTQTPIAPPDEADAPAVANSAHSAEVTAHPLDAALAAPPLVTAPALLWRDVHTVTFVPNEYFFDTYVGEGVSVSLAGLSLVWNEPVLDTENVLRGVSVLVTNGTADDATAQEYAFAGPAWLTANGSSPLVVACTTGAELVVTEHLAAPVQVRVVDCALTADGYLSALTLVIATCQP